VVVTNDNSASTISNTATTDANGNAIFKNIPMGGNTITLSKTGYITGAVVADFGTPTQGQDYLIDGVSKAILPAGRSESIQVEMFNNGSTGSLATIKGTVTIENDLTNSPNATDPLPAGITIQANFNNSASVLGTSNRVSINSYTLSTSSSGGVGTATVTNGAYSMTVPAGASGRQIGLIIPNITGTQHIALNGSNNVAFATGPAYVDVPTVWGPGPGIPGNQTIPGIQGAIGVVAAPPATGAGLGSAFTFPSAVGRSLNFAAQSFPSQTAQWTNSSITYQFDRGTGTFGSSPSVSLSGGGASAQATLFTTLKGLFTGFTGITAGSAYTGNITLTVQYKDRNNTTVKIADFIVPNSSGGLPTTIDLSTFSVGGGNLVVYSGTTGITGTTLNFDSFNAPGGPTDVSAFSVAVTGTAGTGAGANPAYTSNVSGIFATNSGTGYTSAPTISAFTGGAGNGNTPVAQPVLRIADFGLQWNIAFNNAAITSPYSVLPTNIQLNTLNSSAYPIVNTLTSTVLDQNNSASTILSDLAISGTTITLADPAGGVLALHTNSFSAVAPTVVVTDLTPVQVKLPNNAFTINSLTSSPAGAITAINTGGIFTGGTHGVGYNTTFGLTIQPTITGAPGSGATVLLSGFSHPSTGEQQWNGTLAILNQGSGYLQNLNQTQSSIGFGGGTTITVQTGQTYTNNIVYGTGFHQIPVQ